MVAYATAAANPELISQIENTLGKTILMKTGAYLLFRHNQNPVETFAEFADLSSKVWSANYRLII